MGHGSVNSSVITRHKRVSTHKQTDIHANLSRGKGHKQPSPHSKEAVPGEPAGNATLNVSCNVIKVRKFVRARQISHEQKCMGRCNAGIMRVRSEIELQIEVQE